MKTEQLTLEDLAPYLPYGLKCKFHDDGIKFMTTCTKTYVGRNLDNGSGNFTYGYKQVKPIFRPLSDLIKDIQYNSEKIIPLLELAKTEGTIDTSDINPLFSKISGSTYGIRFNIENDDNSNKYAVFGYDIYNGFGYHFRPSKKWEIVSNQIELYKYLYKWHFWLGDQSYFDKGLIIDKSKI